MTQGFSTPRNQHITACRAVLKTLTTQQKEIEKANDVSHVRRRAAQETLPGGGVKVSIARDFQSPVFDGLVTAASPVGFCQVTFDCHGNVQQALGGVGEELGSLSGLTAGFLRQLNTTTSVDREVYLREIVQAAHELAQKYNATALHIQKLQDDTKGSLEAGVKDLNGLLQAYKKFNTPSQAPLSPEQIFEREDARQALLLKIAAYVPIKECVDPLSGLTYLMDAHGGSLVTPEHIVPLQLSPSGEVVRVIGTIQDPLRHEEGLLGGLCTVRETVLPQMIQMLDQMAGIFQRQVNGVHNQGASFQPPESLETGKPLNPALDIRGLTGVWRVAVLEQGTGAVATVARVDLAPLNTLQDLVDALGAVPGLRCSAFAGEPLTLRVKAPQEHGLALVGLDEEGQAALAALGLNDLFVSQGEETGLFKGTAATLQVKTPILQDPRLLAHGRLSTDPTLAVGESGVAASDFDTIDALAVLCGQAWVFGPVGTIPGRIETFQDYNTFLVDETVRQHTVAKTQLESAVASFQGAGRGDDAAHRVNLEDSLMAQQELAQHLGILTQSQGLFQKVWRMLLDFFSPGGY